MRSARSLTLSAIAAVAALALSACSSNPEPSSTDSVTAEEDATTGEFNDADVDFATDMIPHHQQAVAMSQMALDRGGPEVVELAGDIEAAQEPEIETMTQWLSDWGQEAPTGMGDMADMDMLEPGDMEDFMSVSDERFDATWLEMMIEHHEGAITMSKTEQDQGVNPAAVDLAGDIVEAQQAEIVKMEQMLTGN